MSDPAHALRAAEAMIFASSSVVTRAALQERLGPDADIDAIIAALSAFYRGRGVELACVAGGWRFQTAADLAYLFEEVRDVARRLPKPATETLAVIAYHQPVTRAEIEEIRGVSLARGALDLLLELGWVRPLGRRRTPGRPLTFGTTPRFLEHFGLASLDDLPGKDDLRALGLLEGRGAMALEVPRPAEALAEADLQEEQDEAQFFVDHQPHDEPR